MKFFLQDLLYGFARLLLIAKQLSNSSVMARQNRFEKEEEKNVKL
jgi:hypothetical protein